VSRVIFDTSVALTWLQEEDRPAWVDRLIAETRTGTTGLTVPSLFWLEVGDSLARNRTLSDDQAIDGLLRFETLGVETIELERPLRIRALQLARENRLTMYDGTYLALASALRTPLATLDRQLDAASGSLGLSFRGVPGRLAETPVPYGREPDPVSLAAIGATLAELRSRYASRIEEPS
jgi:predicted nucleic acid-binding protein